MPVFAPAQGGIRAERWVAIDRIPVDDQDLVLVELLDEELVWIDQRTELYGVAEPMERMLPEAGPRIRPGVVQHQHAERAVLVRNSVVDGLLAYLRLRSVGGTIGGPL